MSLIPEVSKKDMEFIYNGLSCSDKEKFKDSIILVTGFAGSLGYTLLHFFHLYGDKLGIKKVYGIDNYKFGKPKWIERIKNNPVFDLKELDIVNCDLHFAKDSNIIFHMASLASPVFYRLHPIETMDADVIGLRRLLDLYKNKGLKGFLFYSSSEIYGDPDPKEIPTNENYWGNVNTCGPRACYDESKRFGETLCYNFAKQYHMPITIVRPFNNYGPGMRINDQRVVADFAKAIINNEDIVIYSDGRPTRTFDYIPDATIGYLKCATYGGYDVFNIGSDRDEISILQLAELYKTIGKEIFDYSGSIIFKTHWDNHYLTDNPKRRCPDITKARSLLKYNPQIHIADGIERYLLYLKECNRDEFDW
ncbi:NAD-dependent epimerase/dehydratase family protein [Alkaliphilus pronyensis]|uniref:NAD-dependent epimerase/dehydratase family protein n=1 Tax=Alkaliphilus pronyensis TaxID=1482732 RepID=A0A6I0FKQ2_9FIRM|nr:NAD-dependent epimerase/dehydratase family protein [Alkaliphilus pronyensis]KAB3539667.1 NAD-dependent epimerase/dehydratase family protein [Alkaliphilus pronyensis]